MLNDNEEMALEAEKIIKAQNALVTIEVIAEVEVEEREVLVLGIETYAEQNLDFVDCILYAYKCVKKYDILTFDRKLNKLLANA